MDASVAREAAASPDEAPTSRAKLINLALQGGGAHGAFTWGVLDRLIDDGYVANGSLRRMRIHAVAADDVMTKLGVASKLDANWDFLSMLRDIGRDRAGQWLDADFDRLGNESTVDLEAVYM